MQVQVQEQEAQIPPELLETMGRLGLVSERFLGELVRHGMSLGKLPLPIRGIVRSMLTPQSLRAALPILLLTDNTNDEPKMVTEEEARERLGELLRAIAWASQGLPGGFDVRGALNLGDRNESTSNSIRTHKVRENCSNAASSLVGGTERCAESSLSDFHPLDKDRSKTSFLRKTFSWCLRIVGEVN